MGALGERSIYGNKKADSFAMMCSKQGDICDRSILHDVFFPFRKWEFF